MVRKVLSKKEYDLRYKLSIDKPEVFWSQEADNYLLWDKKWDEVLSGCLEDGNVSWFAGGKLNASVNCLDRNLPHKAEQTAFIWEANEPGYTKTFTYRELYNETCRLANVLKEFGLQKGDSVCIYMPMIPEIVIAMLACSRLGIVHSVVFAGFSPVALKSRIEDLNCKCVITANEGLRGNKVIPLKANVDEALKQLPSHTVKKIIVVKRTDTLINWQLERDYWYHELVKNMPKTCDPVSMDSEDPLFVLYTSGSTGKPKGVLHTTAGYLLYAAITFSEVFDYREQEVYWCTADCGWITGHTYLVYGPLINGAVNVMYEGVPNYPDPSRLWQIVQRHNVNILYTAPTLIRSLMAYGDKFVTKTNRDSLRILGTVGEPINPEAWQWYYDLVGNKKCEIVDTWWQTETGGIAISPIPNILTAKAGAAQLPFYGISPVLVDENKAVIQGKGAGSLLLEGTWPGQFRNLYNNFDRFIQTYFKSMPGYYLTGDGAKRDSDGDLWITGRTDDVVNVSGHRIGTAEIESILGRHTNVVESAVVGIKHGLKGECLYAFVRVMDDSNVDSLKSDLKDLVRKFIGGYAIPDYIQYVPELPKTRSGKIMRRLLRKIASRDGDNLGDVSTLTDPSIIKKIKEGVVN